MKKTTKRLLIIILGAVMFLQSLSLHEAFANSSDNVHLPIEKGRLNDYSISVDKLNELSDSMKSASEDGDAEKIKSLFDEMTREYDHVSTQLALIDLEYSRDISNNKIYAELLKAYDVMYEAADIYFLTLKDVLKGKMKNALNDELEPWQKLSVSTYTASTKEEREANEEELDTVDEYRKIMSEDYKYEYDGKSWTLEEAINSNTLSYDGYIEILNGIEKQQNEAAAGYYKELVELNNKEAEYFGYDNYIDYAYDSIYNRDYKKSDVEDLSKYTKEYLVPLYQMAYYMVRNSEDDANTEMFSRALPSSMLSKIGTYMEEIDPAIAESWTYMRDNDLIEIKAGKNRFDGAFTSGLPEFNAGYIFINARNEFWDYSTVVHEFGHFNANYSSREADVWKYNNTDVSEVQSQGLEVLFAPYWEEICDDEATGKYYSTSILADMLNAVVMGCMYNECEEYAYTHTDESIDEWNRAFGEIYKEYGYEDYTVDGIAYEWVGTNHMFEEPLYYISYATSAVAALDIFSESLHDRDSAVEKYMNVSKCERELYCEMLEKCGLQDVFKKNTIRSIRDSVAEYLEIPIEAFGSADDSFIDEDIEDEFEDAMFIALGVVVAAILFFIIAGLIIALVLEAKRRRRIAKNGNEVSPFNDGLRLRYNSDIRLKEITAI